MSRNCIQNLPEESNTEVRVMRTTCGIMTNYNYLIVDSVTCLAVLVDPAWQMDVIERELMDARANLEGILLTHSHPDHIDLAKPLAEKYHCPIWMSTQEINASGFNHANLVGIDESAWWVGQMLVRPLHTPGHTTGCLCFLIDDNLFSGDVLFAEGCGICPSVDAAHQMYDSLQRLKKELRPQSRIFPGHSFGKAPGQLFSDILQENIYLQFRDKQNFAAFRLRSTQNRAKLFAFQ